MCKDNNYTKLRFTMENDIKEVLLTPEQITAIAKDIGTQGQEPGFALSAKG